MKFMDRVDLVISAALVLIAAVEADTDEDKLTGLETYEEINSDLAASYLKQFGIGRIATVRFVVHYACVLHVAVAKMLYVALTAD